MSFYKLLNCPEDNIYLSIHLYENKDQMIIHDFRFESNITIIKGHRRRQCQHPKETIKKEMSMLPSFIVLPLPCFITGIKTVLLSTITHFRFTLG
jgi:hypothetical protein